MLFHSYNSVQLKNFVATSNIHLISYGAHHLNNFSTFLDLYIVDDENKIENFDSPSRLIWCRSFKNSMSNIF